MQNMVTMVPNKFVGIEKGNFQVLVEKCGRQLDILGRLLGL